MLVSSNEVTACFTACFTALSRIGYRGSPTFSEALNRICFGVQFQLIPLQSVELVLKKTE